jgi:glucose-fructose oxidoreductase
MHREYAVRAAQAGVHVLCEKPMAVTEQECEEMIRAAEEHHVKLMIAYRLHFEEANLKAIDVMESGKIGTSRIFDSVFTQQVESGNIRVRRETGGGTLYDIGIYCINAARHVFRTEPIEAFAMMSGKKGDVEESATCMLRFPDDRLATFCVSFGADKTSEYRIVGTKGALRVEPGYELASGLEHHITREGEEKRRIAYAKRDQFAPELLHFSDCILEDRQPEPSGEEGLADVRVIRALYGSAASGRPVRLAPARLAAHPTLRNETTRPPVRMPRLVHATPPSG